MTKLCCGKEESKKPEKRSVSELNDVKIKKAKQICKRRNQEIDFPKDCQGCEFLNTSSETPYCTYKEQEGKKTSKKSCCH